MDDKDFKKHLKDLAHGHHHPEEHDWGSETATPTASKRAPAKTAKTKSTAKRAPAKTARTKHAAKRRA
jgi:hypothetical protein